MSLNLARSILVGAYELHLAAGDSTRPPPLRHKEGPASTVENRELTIQRIHRALDLLDFFKTRNPEHVMRAVRSLLSRAQPATREMDLVKSMAIEVERTLERETRASFKAALNGDMYEPPASDIPGIPEGASDDVATDARAVADSDA
jgi:tRNA C32,U32 (ribose-2'-O)-methylase TrmJ